MEIKIPEIVKCEAVQCSFNRGGKCHTMAINVGDKEPRCDTFSNNPFYQFFNDPFSDNDNPFQFFFGNPPNNNNHPKRKRPPNIEKREFRQQGLGSGVIVSKSGYILTNFHVISGASEIEIKLDDGRKFQGEIIGSDSLADYNNQKGVL